MLCSYVAVCTCVVRACVRAYRWLSVCVYIIGLIHKLMVPHCLCACVFCVHCVVVVCCVLLLLEQLMVVQGS